MTITASRLNEVKMMVMTAKDSTSGDIIAGLFGADAWWSSSTMKNDGAAFLHSAKPQTKHAVRPFQAVSDSRRGTKVTGSGQTLAVLPTV